MIGGSGEKMMLKVIARHADQWNTFGGPDVFSRKIEILGDHCATVGRNPDEIEVSWSGPAFITDSTETKSKLVHRMAKAFGRPAEEAEPGFLIGPVSEVSRSSAGIH